MTTSTPARRATEAQCQATIIEAAKRFGWMVHAERPATMQSGKWATPIQGDAGFPDLVLLRGPRLIVVELKRTPNKVEAAQTAWNVSLRCAGIDARVLWVPDEMDAFIQELASTPITNGKP